MQVVVIAVVIEALILQTGNNASTTSNDRLGRLFLGEAGERGLACEESVPQGKQFPRRKRRHAQIPRHLLPAGEA